MYALIPMFDPLVCLTLVYGAVYDFFLYVFLCALFTAAFVLDGFVLFCFLNLSFFSFFVDVVIVLLSYFGYFEFCCVLTLF